MSRVSDLCHPTDSDCIYIIINTAVRQNFSVSISMHGTEFCKYRHKIGCNVKDEYRGTRFMEKV
jgi:hypothetical protein